MNNVRWMDSVLEMYASWCLSSKPLHRSRGIAGMEYLSRDVWIDRSWI